MTGSDCSGKTKMEAGPGRHIVGSLDVILWQRDGLINLIMSLPFFLPLLSFLLVSYSVHLLHPLMLVKEGTRPCSQLSI